MYEYFQNNIIHKKVEDFSNLKNYFYGLFDDNHQRNRKKKKSNSCKHTKKFAILMCQIREGGICKKKHNLYYKPLTSSDPSGQDRDPYNYDVKWDEKEHLTLTVRTPNVVTSLYFTQKMCYIFTKSK
ncbi:hypothetical protein PVNG_06437 [Plasmodium vivax North Korean]|uniref:Uncharacterized protein n=1 Tax=Plasmodium vivax North Korean TaxID=1035514 RepID=A0A0J9TZF3_PLAVI|nr:hypothetical protein PVNG_06437 [Plasmodium vivax North Korean]